MGTTRRRYRVAVLGRKLSSIGSGAHIAHLELALELEARGHRTELASLAGRNRTRYRQDVAVGLRHVRRAIKRADVVLVRDEPRVGDYLALAEGKPLLYVAHSPAGDPRPLAVLEDLPDRSLVIFVSRALAANVDRIHGDPPYRHRTIHGLPIDLSHFRVPVRGDGVLLVNLSERKGSPLFWELARRLPSVRFVGVKAWGPQQIPRVVPDNVEILERTPDPRVFYRRSRLVLLPSAEPGEIEAESLPSWGESWNRVGVEAAASGIPAIASPSVGIVASLEDAGVYRDREDIEGWANAILALGEPGQYRTHSERALARAREIEGARGKILASYESAIAEVVG